MLRNAYAFDVDGVIVDPSERFRIAKELSKNRKEFWEVFFSEELCKRDKPRLAGIRAVKERAVKGCIIIITGRPYRLFDITLEQVVEFTGVKPARIYMRRTGDVRPSTSVKLELLERAIREGFNVIEFHDDEEEVLRKIMYAYPDITLYLHYDDKCRLYFKPPDNSYMYIK